MAAPSTIIAPSLSLAPSENVTPKPAPGGKVALKLGVGL